MGAARTRVGGRVAAIAAFALCGGAAANTRGEDRASAPAQCQVPITLEPRAPSFVGRSRELSRIAEALQRGGRVSIAGVGSTGESELATEALWRATEQGLAPQGIVWVKLATRGLEDVTRELATRACRVDLLMRALEPTDVLHELARDLAARGTVVALDDVEDDSHEAVLCALANTRFVQTGRARYLSPCAHDVTEIELAGLEPEECVSLFAREAGLAVDSPALLGVCKQLGYQPLAITLVARRLALRPEPIAELSAALTADALAAQRAGKSVDGQQIARSLALSSDGQLALYRALGAFPAGSTYDEPALAAVGGYADVSALQRDADVLVRLGLLRSLGESRRYTQHELLRRDSRERLEVDRTQLEPRTRYLAHYEKVAAALAASDEARWDRELVPELVHVYTAMQDVVAGFVEQPHDTERAQRLVRWARLLGRYSVSRGVRMAYDWFTAAHAAAVTLQDVAAQGVIALHQARLSGQLGRGPERILWNEKALAAARRAHDRATEAAALSTMGSALLRLGHSAAAVDRLTQALTVVRELGDRAAEARCLSDLGSAHIDLGDVSSALADFEQALSVARALADRPLVCNQLSNLGHAYAQLSPRRDLSRAMQYLEQALFLAQKLGQRRLQATILGTLGVVYRDRGELPRALDALEHTRQLAQQLADRDLEARQLMALGSVHAQLGEVQDALRDQQQALAIATSLGNRRTEASCLHDIGSSFELLGESGMALQYWERALATYTALKSPRAETLRATIEAARARGQ